MDASSLIAPIGFTGSNSHVQVACSSSRPSALVSWGFEDPGKFTEDEIYSKIKGLRYGVVMGCEDGSLYFFHPDGSTPKSTRRRSARSDLSTLTGSLSISHRYPHHLALTTSRGPSPTSSKANLSVSASKSRAVSGLSKEQVEAPKNFVDFDEEQEKLKELVNDRSPRERGFIEGLLDRTPLPTSKSSTQQPVQTNGHKDTSRRQSEDLRSPPPVDSYPSTAPLTPASSPSSPASVSSPQVEPLSFRPGKLGLFGRTLLKRVGEGHAVRDMKAIQNGKIVVVLQESGVLSLFKTYDGLSVATTEIERFPPTSKTVPDANFRSVSQPLWTWRRIHVLDNPDSTENTFIVTMASVSKETMTPDRESSGSCRLCVFELEGLRCHEFGETKVTKIGDVVFRQHFECTDVLLDEQNNIVVYTISRSSQKLTSRVIQINRPSPRLSSEDVCAAYDHQHQHQLLSAAAIPEAIKGLAARAGAGRNSPKPPEEPPQKVQVVSEGDIEVGEVNVRGTIVGMKMWKCYGVAAVWSDEGVQIMDLAQGGLSLVTRVHTRKPWDVRFSPNGTLIVSSEDRVSCYDISKRDASSDDGNMSPSVVIEDIQTPFTSSGYRILSTKPNKTGQLEILSYKIVDDNRSPSRSRSRSPGKKLKPRCLWSPTDTAQNDTGPNPRVTAVLPLELAEIVLGYSNGFIRKATFPDLLTLNPASLPNPPHDNSLLGAAILNFFLVHNETTQEPIVVGGGDDGSIAFWELSTLRLRARWVVFVEPLVGVIHVKEKDVDKEESGMRATARRRLCGSSFCVSRDGTVAVVAIDGFEFLYVIPGSSTPLQRLCLGENDLLLFYADGRTRMWDVRTREFWRSMSAEKAGDMLSQGGWFDATVDDKKPTPSPHLLAYNHADSSSGPAPAVFANLVVVIQNFVRALGERDADDVAVADQIRALLAMLYAPGLDEIFDGCSPLETHGGRFSVGYLDCLGNLQWNNPSSPYSSWQTSPQFTATRLLCIVSLVNVLRSLFGKGSLTSGDLSTHIATLPHKVGSAYQPPDLAYLALYWGESPSLKIREAAGAIFESEVQRIRDEEVSVIVEKWQHRLPCVLPDSRKQSSSAALALNLCGSVATVKYRLLSAAALSDIAKSITIYLHNDASPHRPLAIELCSRGFDVWQHYFDAMEVLRSLFSLATSARKDTISTRNPGQQARMAVMRIASSNSPLFVTTLSLDILHPKSAEYTATIMQVLAFLMKRDPMVLYPNLPRLLEAVVKSLDPSSSADREVVLDAATEILGQVVRTFPTVDFHTDSQRLAVGTSEGAVIMYDLKTATRLYILEGHRKRLAGISFSPDGRRLVTLGLEENVVLVWKVGSSFTSFFHPGAPPRQGHAGSDPYKTLNFVLVGGIPEGKDALERVSFEWPNSRSVRVKICDTTLTFST